MKLNSLELCYTASADWIQAFSDSRLVVSQLNGEYETKNDAMVAYFRLIWEATRLLKHFIITHVPWWENCQVDTLSKLASSSEDGKPMNI